MNILDDIEVVDYEDGQDDKYGYSGYCFDKCKRTVTYRKKQFHSFNDLPAVTSPAFKVCEFYFDNGLLHRIGKPAVTFFDKGPFPEILYVYYGTLESYATSKKGKLRQPFFPHMYGRNRGIRSFK